MIFPCPCCGKPLEVKEELAGNKGSCPHCRQSLTIPAPLAPPRPGDLRTLPPRKAADPQTLVRGPNRLADQTTQGAEPPTDTHVPDRERETHAGHFDFLAPAQQPGEMGRLGPFRVLKVLGQGGMGIVFQAEDSQLQRLVALKVMKPSAGTDARQRFLREARAAAALDHDHVVHIYHVGEDRGVPYLAMQFLQGESLEERLRREGTLPAAEVVRIGREVADGLAAAHAHGLIHRDIKPGNIWLEGERGRAKILDFGLVLPAAAQSQLTQLGAVLGTPGYMAPEQANGTRVDARADLFSLGCLLYRMATGTPPFTGPDSVAMLIAVVAGEPDPPRTLNPKIHPALSDLIQRLLAKDPAKRCQTASEVAQLLGRFVPSGRGPDARKEAVRPAPASPLAGPIEPNVAPPPPTKPAPQRGPARRRTFIVAGVAAAVLLVGGIVLLRPTPTVQDDKASAEQAWLKKVAALPAEQQVPAVMARLKELNPGFDGKETHVVSPRGVVTELRFLTDNVKDLSPVQALTGLETLACHGSDGSKGQLANLEPLKDLRLTSLNCFHNKVSDLSPLKDMRLTFLECSDTPVSDLAPLRDMKLTTLYLWGTRVADLSPLKNMKLSDLDCSGTGVSDLSVLKGMPLTRLVFSGTPVSNLSPLKDMKLTFLCCPGTKVSDLSPLKNMKLTELNCDDTQIADLSPLANMKLTNLYFRNSRVADLSPLKEMNLERLNCGGTAVSDLSVLKGMKLTVLYCYGLPVSDLSPLKGMKLTVLWCEGTKVSDLSLLKDMKLTELGCANTKVADLSPLKGMPLTVLACWNTPVADLSPLKGMQLRSLNCGITRVSDLSPLKGMPLTELWCGGTKVSDLSPLKNMKLTELNCDDTPIADLSPLASMKLTGLGFRNSRVADLSPLKGMNLARLNFSGTRVSDPSPLKDMKLTWLDCGHTAVADLSPLKGMPLTELRCGGTKVSDLSPLKGMPLTRLECFGTPVADLSPLKDMKLTFLWCEGTKGADLSPLRGMPLKELRCDFKLERDAELLRSIKTLETINGKPAKEFLSPK